MPKTLLRQFTGGISNEIDAQNLREDQGEEAVDINLKGFALEPGDGISPLTDAKHYYYRGEWIEDSKAVSFEESGVGVIKTYDDGRPKFEEIINNEANDERNLGPALPPDAIITGTVVSEGTRGENPADGSHLLELPGEKFGAVDTADPITDAPSLVEHKVTTTADENHIYYYSGQPYWVEKSGDDWTVKTRQWSSGSNKFLGGEWTSATLNHNSGGSFFKEGFFICWDAQYIDIVTLSNSSMSVDTLDTLGVSGNQGTDLGFTSGSTAVEISSADVSSGIVTFVQTLKTLDRTGGNAITKYTDSDKERWIKPRDNDSYLLLLRDGHAYEYAGDGPWNATNRLKLFLPTDPLTAPHESEGKYDAGDDAVEITTNAGGTRAVEWVNAKASSGSHWSPKGYDYTIDMGLKFIVVYLPKGEWACVKQLGTNKPEIIVVESKGKTIPDPEKKEEFTDQTPCGVKVTRSFSEDKVTPAVRTKWRAHEDADWIYYTWTAYRLTVNVDMTFPQIDGSIHWSANPIPEVQIRWSNNTSQNKSLHTAGYAYGTHIRGGAYRKGFRWAYGDYIYSAQRMKIDVEEWSNHHGPAHELDKRNRWVRTLNLGNGRNDRSDRAQKSTMTGKRSILYSVSSNRSGHGIAINTISPPNYNAGDRYAYNNETKRLCSFPYNSSLTVREYAAQSTIHTVATIAKADKSISFAEATAKTFAEGDYIRVSEGYTNGESRGSYRRISSNLPFTVPKYGPQYFGRSFIAKIKSIETGKLILEAIPGFKERFMVGVDEKCYPIITTIDNDVKNYWEKSIPKQTRELIRTNLSSHILLGCSHGRQYGHVGDKQLIEVRNTTAERYVTGTGVLDAKYGHKIKWQNNTIRAVNLATNEPRIVYIENKFLKSQDGDSSNRNPRLINTKKSSLTDKAKIHLTSDLLTVVDKDGITVYDPLFGILFVKDKPEKPKGLGISGKVIDGFGVKNGYGTFIFIKLDDGYWKMVRTGTEKPETTLLSYNFTKPIEFDGSFAWGILKTASGTYDIHTTVPFYESDIDHSWINHSATVGNTANARSAWGQVITTRLNAGDGSSNNKRWISVDWKYDSGNYLNLGDPVIGLAHETNKMIGVTNEFTWYIKDAPATLHDSGTNQGTIIEDPKIAIKFTSGVTRDVVFFKSAETSLPPSGATGYENRVSFINYAVASQDFYVLSSKYITLAGTDPEEEGYRMGQAAKLDSSHHAFDASRVGKSAFLIGAPNMYNPYGPNIDFYYRASFIDKWNHESVPSPLPPAGITPLDSADDCIQVNLSPNFFRWDNTDITKIRLYRYGGDSSEFMFLRDIEMPGSQLPLALEKPVGGTFNGTLAIKAAQSPFYNLSTYFDVSVLSTLTNSAFDLTALPVGGGTSDIDGSWRINQIYETQTEQTFTGTNDGGVLKIISEAHGLADDDIIRVSSTGTLPGNLDSIYYYTVANKTTDNFNLIDPLLSLNEINYSSAGTPTHTWRKVGYETTLIHDLNETDTTVLLTSEFPDTWPSKGVIKIDKEYISYSGISSTNGVLTVGTIAHGGDHTDGTYTSVALSGGSGSGTKATVTVSSNDVTAITITTVGSGYTVANSLTIPNSVIGGAANATCAVATISTDDLTGCVRGHYDSEASSHSSVIVNVGGNAPTVSVVEWVIEMEHRNQDTTVLDGAIENLSGSVPAIIVVTNTALFPSSGTIKVGNQLINYSGKTGNTFTGCTHNANGGEEVIHADGVTVFSYNETYTATSYTDIQIVVSEFGYRDKARTPVMSLHSMKEDNYPPLPMKYNDELKKFYAPETQDHFFRYITAVGSLYFGAVDADLRFSRYGTPEYWPLEAVVTLDSEIKAIREHAGEGIVFTTNSVYRVRGTDPKAMIAFRVPDAKGIKDGDRHSVAEFNGGLIWKTASDGLCMYSGGRVSYITRDKHDIPDLNLPYSCVADGSYWLFQRPKADREEGDTGNGFRLDISSGDMRLCQTSIQAYYAYFAKALGKAVVVTSDNSLTFESGITHDEDLVVEEIGGVKISNLSWRSKKLDAGDPAVGKALGSIAIVYESLESQTASTLTDGIRGESLAVTLLRLPSPDDLDAGDLSGSALDDSADLYDVFTRYDSVGQEFIVDIGGTNWDADQRKTVLMPVGFDTDTINEGDSIWNELFDDNTKVESIGQETVGGTVYPTIVLDKEPLRSGDGIIVWGDLPQVHIYVNNQSDPERSFTLPPIVSEEPQSVDLYLEDLKKFRTVSIAVEGNLRINTMSLRYFPIQQFQSQTLHHSADIFYKGIVDFRVKLDGDLIYRKELSNAGDEFTEERIYLPASSFGSRVHYMNESRNGMIESVTFNGSLAA